jgi:hypothetical protein
MDYRPFQVLYTHWSVICSTFENNVPENRAEIGRSDAGDL